MSSTVEMKPQPCPSPLGQRLLDEDVLIVTVDLEMHCRNQSREQYIAAGRIRTSKRRISEIRLAMIDTRDLKYVSLSASGLATEASMLLSTSTHENLASSTLSMTQ